MTNSQPEICVPKLFGPGRDIALYIVHVTHRHAKKAIWSMPKIENEFGRRTVAQIVTDGTTFAYAPCSERTLVAAATLVANDIVPTVIYHERRIPGFGPSTPHFALEFEIDGAVHMMDFGARESRFMPGPYWYDKRWQETITIQRSEVRELDPQVDTVELLYGRYITPEIDVPSKLAWYESQISRPNPAILEERIALSEGDSIYEPIA